MRRKCDIGRSRLENRKFTLSSTCVGQMMAGFRDESKR